MPGIDNEGFDYRSSVPMGTIPPQGGATRQDIANFSTLQAVEKILATAVEDLYRDFNAFNLPDGVPKTTAIYNLQRQIDGKQEAYSILAPVLESVRATIDQVNRNFKR